MAKPFEAFWLELSIKCTYYYYIGTKRGRVLTVYT